MRSLGHLRRDRGIGHLVCDRVALLSGFWRARAMCHRQAWRPLKSKMRAKVWCTFRESCSSKRAEAEVILSAGSRHTWTSQKLTDIPPFADAISSLGKAKDLTLALALTIHQVVILSSHFTSVSSLSSTTSDSVTPGAFFLPFSLSLFFRLALLAATSASDLTRKTVVALSEVCRRMRGKEGWKAI